MSHSQLIAHLKSLIANLKDQAKDDILLHVELLEIEVQELEDQLVSAREKISYLEYDLRNSSDSYYIP